MIRTKTVRILAILFMIFTLCFGVVSCKGNNEILPNEYTVSFDSNGGTSIPAQTVIEGNKVIQPANPEKSGFNFGGWYLDGTKFDFDTTITKDITLEAEWKEVIINNYMVFFDSAGGSRVDLQSVVDGNKVIKPTNPTKEGYTFVGWYLNDEAYDFNSPVNSNITLVAKWKEIVNNSFTVIFNTNGGSQVEAQKVNKGNKVTKPEAPIKDGYTFIGWFLNGTKFDFETPITKDITLEAEWKEITVQSFVVVFDTKGGSKIENIIVSAGKKITRPEDPTKEGYIFDGWYLNGQKYDFTSQVNSNITLVARWRTNGLKPGDKEEGWDFVCKVTFMDGDTILKEITVDEGQIVPKPIDPIKEGYIFKGWYLNNTEFDFSKPIYTDYILVAKFENKLEAQKEVRNFNNSLSKDGELPNGPLTEGCLPSKSINGKNPQILVFPIKLQNNYSNLEYVKFLDTIRLAFNGTKEETGWESLNSYYEASSYGKLKLDITVNDEWFYDKEITSASLNKMDIDYKNGISNIDPNTFLLTRVLDKYNQKFDYKKFDSNNDQFIDAVWFVYDTPVDFTGESMYWAYCAQSYEWYDETKPNGMDNTKARDGVYAMYYAWAGIDFMNPNANMANYPTAGIKVDAHTFIHETGHLMGLDDYYDYNYNQGSNSGLYGADMMDANIGDHGVINKLLLDWIDPIEITGRGEISLDLASFTTSGEAIIIADHQLDNIYDTYYLIEYYTNDGLNANDKAIKNGNGIRITLARAELNKNSQGEVVYNEGEYWTTFKYDNSDTSLPFIEMILPNNVTASYDTLSSKHLFNPGDSVFLNNFSLRVNNINNGKINVTINII